MISISIMAHEKRAHYIPYLFEKLGYECPVAWDLYQDRWETGRRAWEMHDPAASHHLVLQDDVLLSLDLPQVLEELVKTIADQPISLFAHDRQQWNRFIERCQNNPNKFRWMLLKRLNWGPAVLLPVKDIYPMIEWVEENCFMPNYDVRIGYYYMIQQKPVWYTMPSLVDHRTEGESLVWQSRAQEGRRAKYFIGEERSGLDLDWRKGAVCESLSMEHYLKQHMIVNETWRLKNKGDKEFNGKWRLKRVNEQLGAGERP